jgi:hypothetical protein
MAYVGVKMRAVTGQGPAPPAAASLCSITWSMLKLAAFCRGGKSLNVWAVNAATTAA